VKVAPPRPERADAAPETATSGAHSRPLVPPPPVPGLAPRWPATRSPKLVRLLKGVAILLGVAGVLALADGVATLVWQEPISSLIAHFDQARLAQSLKRLDAARATPAEERALGSLPTDNQRMAFFARELQQTARAGQAVGRIRIPRIGANFVVVAGTDEASLQKGPGIYSGTAVPGLRGTVGIAGHRTTYLAPFRRINELAKGDRITLEMPYGLFSYTVVGHRIVSPTDVTVLQRASYDQVVLTACNPLYSAAQRIVVFARLTADAPAGPALAAVPAVAAPALMPAVQAGQTVLGDVLGPTAVSPGIDSGGVIVGATPGAPGPAPRVPSAQVPARPGPGPSTPAAPTRSATPRAATPAPVVAPVPVAPPAPAIVHRPTPAPVHRPVVAKPPPSSPPPSTPTTPKASPPASPPSQTRVYGGPGGPAPIIDVPTSN
jgi:sortase A